MTPECHNLLGPLIVSCDKNYTQPQKKNLKKEMTIPKKNRKKSKEEKGKKKERK
jgi:hypothetical protein